MKQTIYMSLRGACDEAIQLIQWDCFAHARNDSHLYKRTFLIALFLFILAGTAHALPPQYLTKGHSVTLEVEYDIGDIAITDDKVCDYVVQENRRAIYLNPKKDGRVSLTLWDAEGIKREMVPITVASANMNDVIEDARTGEMNLKDVGKEIERAIADPEIHAKIIQDKIVLEGTVYNQETFARAERIARLYDESILNLISVRDLKRNLAAGRLIQLDVHFMEIKKNALRTFGINWAPGSMPAGGSANASLGGGGGAGLAGGLNNIGTSLIGFVLNLAPKLKLARQKGFGRVLENPAFLVKSGEAAEFFSGTQVPYYSQEAVVFKDVGIKIQAEPIASGGDVDLKININVTSPSAGGINKGIDTNTISTVAYCKAGESIALGGIFRNADAKMINRVPDDTNTSSALFSLFLSKDFLSNQSEFVIFVTPKIVEGPADAAANPTTLKLDDWQAINEDIVKKRSRKEYRQKKKPLQQNEVQFAVPDSLMR